MSASTKANSAALCRTTRVADGRSIPDRNGTWRPGTFREKGCSGAADLAGEEADGGAMAKRNIFGPKNDCGHAFEGAVTRSDAGIRGAASRRKRRN